MRSIPCIVCESTGDWAAALEERRRRSSIGEGPTDSEPDATKIGLRFIETRSPTECRRRWHELRMQGIAAPIVVELTEANAERVCELLLDHLRDVGDAPRFVVMSRRDTAYEAIAREAGATAVAASTRELRPLVEALLRYAAEAEVVPTYHDDDDHSTLDRLLAELPKFQP